MSKKTVSGVTLTLLFIGMLTLAFNIYPIKAENKTVETIIRIVPEEIVLGSPALENVINTTFTIAVVIENVIDLYGFDIQWCWNTTYLEYLNHITTVPVEDYAYPIPPSPYPGILHRYIMKLKDAVDESASIPDAEPGTMAWIGYSSSIAFSFNGSGTVCIMTFRVKHQPYFAELPEDFNYVNLTFRFIRTKLARATPVGPIPHEVEDGIVKLYAQPLPPYSPTARFTATPEIAKRLESVEFDASGSLPGFNGTHEVPIVRYYWDFGDSSNMTTTEHPIVHHRFTHSGIYYVTLFVYSPEAYPVTDSTTHKVTVLSISIGGYSVPIGRHKTTKSLTLYLLLAALLTIGFTMIKHKTHIIEHNEVRTNPLIRLLGKCYLESHPRDVWEEGMLRKTVSGMILFLLVFSMLALSYNIQPAKSNPTTIVVPDDYPTIQEAINNANEGDTIFVRNGTYYGRIVVNKRVSLVGEEKWTTVVDGSNNTTPITILASGVNISGFTIRNSSKLNPWFNPGTDGLYMEADNCTISHNIFSNNARGIRIYKSINNTFYKNIITDNWADGFVVAGYCGDNTLDSNNVSNNGLGIVLYFTRYGGVLRNNKMMNNSYNFVVRPKNPGRLDIDSSNTVNGKPVYYWVGEHDREVPQDAGYVAIVNSRNILVKNLTVTDSGQGVLLYNSRNCSVREVNVFNSLNGIMLWDSENCTIHNNTIVGCTVFLETLSGNGIFLLYSNNNTFYDNNITDNKFHGISLSASQNNMFYHNSVINNWCQVKIYKLWWESWINTWDCGYPSGGNYWSDYNGTDLYVGPCQNETGRDGLGDTPYVIDEDNEDRYPLMNPWGINIPVASFTWTPSIPEVGESVTFDASSSTPSAGEIVSYEWNFGDYSYGSGELVSHTYTSPDVYAVTLNVTDSEGLWDIEQKQIRVVQPHGPEAEFTATPDTASIGDSIKFDASASLPGWNGTHETPIVEYRWDVGGGIKITTPLPLMYYSFISPGIYYVTLTVYAPGATPETDTTSREVTIISVPIGGYSLPIKRYTTVKPLMPYMILVAVLTSVLATIKRERHRRAKRS